MDNAEPEPPHICGRVLKELEKTESSIDSEREEADIEVSDYEIITKENINIRSLNYKKKKEDVFKNFMKATLFPIATLIREIYFSIVITTVNIIILLYQKSLLMGETRKFSVATTPVSVYWTIIYWVGFSAFNLTFLYYMFKQVYTTHNNKVGENKERIKKAIVFTITGIGIYFAVNGSMLLYERYFNLSYYLVVLHLYIASALLSAYVIIKFTKMAYNTIRIDELLKKGRISDKTYSNMREFIYYLVCFISALLIAIVVLATYAFINDMTSMGSYIHYNGVK
ncbi:hypothetical protein NEFER01_0913 [Nematocida sp. LUAm1]|nr:hypothetical protein NEFER02_1283 [Nematocida sp. LUAm2]KAI5177689.1 hypothetical protein NEFER01_0913 [Nematocida sp. LUAm1]